MGQRLTLLQQPNSTTASPLTFYKNYSIGLFSLSAAGDDPIMLRSALRAFTRDASRQY